MQRHSLFQQQSYYVANIPSNVEPIYVVLNAFTRVSTATSSLSSVSINLAYLMLHNES